MRLSTVNQHREFKVKGEKQVAKFMPQYDGPYTIIAVDKEHSMVTLDLPNVPNIFPTFHSSEIIPYIESDQDLFPSCKFEEPLPVETKNGDEYFFECILDMCRHRCSWQYLVWWRGYGQEHDKWPLGLKLQDCQALDDWLASQVGSP